LPKSNSPRNPNGFARTLAREEFGRFYWNDALATEVARQQAKAAGRIGEMRARWKAEARARAKAAQKELRRRMKLARQHRAPGE
jgi:hypothetical protein